MMDTLTALAIGAAVGVAVPAWFTRHEMIAAWHRRQPSRATTTIPRED